MTEEPQVCCYTVDGTHHVCRKPLLDDGEVWLRGVEMALNTVSTMPTASGEMIDPCKFADNLLLEFKVRFRS